MTESSEKKLPSRAITERFGITRRTLDRWMKKPDLDFPTPTVINGRLYFKLDDIETWETNSVRRVASVLEAA